MHPTGKTFNLYPNTPPQAPHGPQRQRKILRFFRHYRYYPLYPTAAKRSTNHRFELKHTPQWQRPVPNKDRPYSHLLLATPISHLSQRQTRRQGKPTPRHSRLTRTPERRRHQLPRGVQPTNSSLPTDLRPEFVTGRH